MRQVYYSIDNLKISPLKEKIIRYNELLRDLYSKESNDKKEIATKKNECKLEIEHYIKMYATILGFLSEGELDMYDEFKNGIHNKELEQVLGNNVLLQNELEQVLIALANEQSCKINEKLSYIFKEAKKQNKSIIVWIM